MKRIVVIVVLFGLAVWVIWQGTRPASAPQDMPAWSPIDTKQVRTITLRPNPKANIRIEWQTGRWMLMQKKPLPANAQSVERLLKDLAMMRPVRLVTSNPEQHTRLKVGDDGARLVLQDTKGRVLLDLIVGKHGTDLISTYVRRDGSPEVFAVNRALVWQVKRGHRAWQAPGKPIENKKQQTSNR